LNCRTVLSMDDFQPEQDEDVSIPN
jgi:hypothetical protein